MVKAKNKAKVNRRRTRISIERVIDEIDHMFQERPSLSQIWKGICHKDLNLKQQYFLWMLAHEAYRVRDYWLRMNNLAYQWRGYCQHCESKTETLEHILTECTTPGQKESWGLAEQLWKLRHKTWLMPGPAAIIACTQAHFPDRNGTPTPGDTRLYQILVTETAHLIWKIRCQRVIEGNNIPKLQTEIHN